MADTMTVKMALRGVLTLPKALRESYNLQPGDTFTLLDLGGIFLLSPKRLEVDGLADQISASLLNQGETLESMLKALREDREKYG